MVIRLIVFAGALTGLLAMHGLSDHGAAASHAGHAPSNHTATATVHSNQMATAAHGAAEDVGLTVGESDEGSPGMAMAGLCLAVLAGAIPPDPDGWVQVTIAYEDLDQAAFELLRFGSDVEVIEPVELRERIASTARAMVDRYAPVGV